MRLNSKVVFDATRVWAWTLRPAWRQVLPSGGVPAAFLVCSLPIITLKTPLSAGTEIHRQRMCLSEELRCHRFRSINTSTRFHLLTGLDQGP